MKTNYFKRIASALSLFMIVAFTAASTPNLSLTAEKKIVLVLNNLTENTELVIKDAKGYAFYSQTIKDACEKFVKTFDLTTLPDGVYTIEVDQSTLITNYPITIVDDKVNFSLDDKTYSYKPTVTEGNQRVIITKFNPENKPLLVNIYDNHGELVFEEELSGKIDLGRIYNFSKVQGTYTITMQSDDKTYSKSITIK